MYLFVCLCIYLFIYVFICLFIFIKTDLVLFSVGIHRNEQMKKQYNLTSQDAQK